MDDPGTLTLALALAAGAALGAVFFGGLWWTVRRAVASPHPARWFIASLLLRMGVVLAGFYAVGGGQWLRWLACLLGFVLARLLLVRLSCPTVAPPGSRTKEVGHAP
ncbi:MAG: ATP synthase subunit I [Verrucomicrobiales bacterium]|nr:ATP synthase subunit I [Verrucomicrobiales bacterium]